jgi:NTP pyrophosphatase (non-canonical NTP hydrolase)
VISAAEMIAARLRTRHTGASLDVQMLCLAEEVGEVVQAYRRATGRARSAASWDSVAEELADVVIVSYVTAALADIDLSGAVTRKLAAIEERGGI